jgi:crossover junction endodeoxyribonuclease RuvC
MISFGEKTFLLGVDPGLTGALALYCLGEKKLKDVIDMPTLPSKKGEKKELDLDGLALYLLSYRHKIRAALIERVSAAPDQGVVSMFRFGFVSGAVAGAVAAHLLPIHYVYPAVWKSLLGLSYEKTFSRERAMMDFPEWSEHFQRKKDDGRAEASLIAKFGERIYTIKETLP